MHRRTPLRLVAPGLGLAALLLAPPADAYCRTSSCLTGAPHTAAVCTPPAVDDCGTPLAWPSACIEFSVQESASKKVTFAQTEQVLTTAFATWMGVACPGGGSPHVLVTEGPKAVCALHEYNQMNGNASVVLFHDDVWPYEGSSNTLALTTVTYALDTGAIYDADMELNSADNDFTVGDAGVDFDLLSIVTHEAGHFLGLAHSHDMTATMWPVYSAHSTSERHPAADDIAGICAIYPPGDAICSCDPTPRHGFSAECAAQQTGMGTMLGEASDHGPGQCAAADGGATTSTSSGATSSSGASSSSGAGGGAPAGTTDLDCGCNVPGDSEDIGARLLPLAVLLGALAARRRRSSSATRAG